MVLCDDLEGWDGGGVEGRLKRKGIYVYLQLIHFILQQKLIQYFKAIILQLKKKKQLASGIKRWKVKLF